MSTKKLYCVDYDISQSFRLCISEYSGYTNGFVFEDDGTLCKQLKTVNELHRLTLEAIEREAKSREVKV